MNKRFARIFVCMIAITMLQCTYANGQQGGSSAYGHSTIDNEVERPAMEIAKISSNECQPNQCMVVGMQAYSEPRCVDLGAVGDFCRPQDWIRNATLYYPNKIVEAENIFSLFCPCSAGLECVRATCNKIR